MAIATAYKPVNMDNWQIWYGTATIHTSSHIRVVSGGRVQDYYGSGFTYNAYGDVTGGVMKGTTYTLFGVKQYSITGMRHDAETVYDYLAAGNADQLLAFGFRGNDTLNGSSSADRINGYRGDDIMNGKGGIDKVNGGAGNDTLVFGAGDTLLGGTGLLDTLRISAAALDLSNDTANPNTRLTGFEQIDLRTGIHALKLAEADVLDMSSTSTIKILGDALDSVNIVGAEVAGGDAPVGFTLYTIGSAILIIDSDISVVNPA